MGLPSTSLIAAGAVPPLPSPASVLAALLERPMMTLTTHTLPCLSLPRPPPRPPRTETSPWLVLLICLLAARPSLLSPRPRPRPRRRRRRRHHRRSSLDPC